VTGARHFQRSFTAAYGERHPHFVELGWQASSLWGFCLVSVIARWDHDVMLA